MTLEESHFHPNKSPNRSFENDKYLSTTFEKSLYHAAKIPNRGSVNTVVRGTHAL
jgi:hypothetical protein